MQIRSKTLIDRLKRSMLRVALLSSVAVGVPLLAADSTTANNSEQLPDGQNLADHRHGGHDHPPAKLVQIVRENTWQFIDVNAATDYEPAFGCVSGPDHGAMGVHYINSTLVGDGEV